MSTQGPVRTATISYEPRTIEAGWQRRWQAQGLYQAREELDRPKYYCLDFFPYPSGNGLSVGHCRQYAPTDIVSRFLRLRGYSVLHPMGWDAFGEPAEQYAISQGVHPRLTTDQNSANYKRQFDLIGISFDWEREIDSSQPEYYRWTQWFFLQLYQRGLAYRDTQWQWWCPICQTTLSNQEARDGVCWRGHGGLTKKEIPAWYFKITDYADQLLDGLNEIDWPEAIKAMQENWIGRSEGTRIEFHTESGLALPVFTTRPDTVFGVTFVAIAPEHPELEKMIVPEKQAAVAAYVERAKGISDIDRQSTEREQTGVFTGCYTINPLNDERVQLWVGDYVLGSYGTGVVMGVPAHDTRDFAFATRYGIPIKPVIAPPGWSGDELTEAHVGPGTMINSGPFDGTFTPGDWKKLPAKERQVLATNWGFAVESIESQIAKASSPDQTNGIRAVTEWVAERGLGSKSIQYRMRDWLISRQHYWGAPIPVVYCPVHGEQSVPEEQLPVRLPDLVDFQPDGSGRAPLARSEDWVKTTCPICDGPARRETDTMGGFACSSWYFLRFTSPDYQEGPFQPERMRYWMPVDHYVGGAEHAVMHLLYARFWTRVMHDAGLLPFAEPFQKLTNQGMLVVSTPHRRAPDPDATEAWIPITPEEAATLPPDGVQYRSAKMSKSLYNVITPDEMVAKYGADSLRVYLAFIAPYDQEVEWSEDGINGVRRFLSRVWDLTTQCFAAANGARFTAPDEALTRLQHKTIRRVTRDLERFHFNTAVAALMEFANALSERHRSDRWGTASFQEAVETLVRLLSPMAPFLSEGLWQITGGFGRTAQNPPYAGEATAPFDGPGSIHQQPWPSWSEDLTRDETVTIVVQVNGKIRERLEVPAEATEEEVRAAALASPKVQSFVTNAAAARFVYVAGKILNIVGVFAAKAG